MLFGPANPWRRLALGIAGVLAVLAVSPLLNHSLLGARASGVERAQAFYDLAAIAAQAPDSAIGLTPAEARAIAAKRCIKPFFWDPLGDPTRCGGDMERLHGVTAGPLYRMLGEAIVRHPFAYAAHRLEHLNATGRWLVAAHWPSAAPPAVSEPNDEGLESPGGAARAWQAAARSVAETPLGWPVAWVVLALCGAVVAVRRVRSALRDFALALFVSALALEASFAVISISSDLRYHLWPMVATALAAVLLWTDAPWPRRALLAGGAALALIVASGTAARLMLPAPPASYQALLQ